MTAAAPLNAGAAAVFASLLEARTGQRLSPDRTWRIETALRPLLAALELETVEQLLCRLLDGQDRTVGDRIVDTLLNQETSFFRDGAAIENAARFVIDAASTASRRPRVWCAACATGQEPLSLAMVFGEQAGVTPELIATDVSSAAITRARTGVYSHFEVQRGLAIRRMMRWFSGGDDGSWTASPELLAAVAYRRQNLVADPAPAGQFDLILCRNVLFYLAPPLREGVLAKLHGALSADGLLLLGAGETVIGQTDLLRPSGRARGFYERADRDEAVAARNTVAR